MRGSSKSPNMSFNYKPKEAKIMESNTTIGYIPNFENIVGQVSLKGDFSTEQFTASGTISTKNHFQKRDFSPKFVRSQMIKKLRNKIRPVNHEVTNLSSKLLVDIENNASKIDIRENLFDKESVEEVIKFNQSTNQILRKSPNAELSYFISLKQ